MGSEHRINKNIKVTVEYEDGGTVFELENASVVQSTYVERVDDPDADPDMKPKHVRRGPPVLLVHGFVVGMSSLPTREGIDLQDLLKRAQKQEDEQPQRRPITPDCYKTS